MKTKQKIDDMMFTIVAIQNMLLDYTIAAENHTLWEFQLRWQKMNFNDHGHESLEKLLQNLALAEEHDVKEQTDPAWFSSQVKKR